MMSIGVMKRSLFAGAERDHRRAEFLSRQPPVRHLVRGSRIRSHAKAIIRCSRLPIVIGEDWLDRNRRAFVGPAELTIGDRTPGCWKRRASVFSDLPPDVICGGKSREADWGEGIRSFGLTISAYRIA